MVLKSLDNDVNHNLKLSINPAAIKDTKAISVILAQSFYDFPEFAHWVYPFLRFTINEDLRYRLRSSSPHYRCLVAKIIPSDNRSHRLLRRPLVRCKASALAYCDLYKTEQRLRADVRRKGMRRDTETAQTVGQDLISSYDSQSIIVGTIEIALRSSLWSNSPQYPYISNLAVAPDYRRLGIGTKLLAACEQGASDWGYQETRLHVLDRNESAKQLYSHNGYQISQIEPNWGNLWFDCSPRLLLKKTVQTS